GARSPADRGHGDRHRADGERREAGGESVVGRLDGGDPRRQPRSALRAHGGGDGGGTVGSGGGTKSSLAGAGIEQLPSALYRVRLDGGATVTAHIGGRVDRNFIRLLVGDRVRVELSPVDPGRGRIVEKI